MRILGIVLLSLAALSLIIPIMPIIQVRASDSPIPLSLIQSSIRNGLQYLYSLVRVINNGNWAIVSEYPGLPIAINAPSLYVASSQYTNVWFIPGFRTPNGPLDFIAKADNGTIASYSSLGPGVDVNDPSCGIQEYDIYNMPIITKIHINENLSQYIIFFYIHFGITQVFPSSDGVVDSTIYVRLTTASGQWVATWGYSLTNDLLNKMVPVNETLLFGLEGLNPGDYVLKIYVVGNDYVKIALRIWSSDRDPNTTTYAYINNQLTQIGDLGWYVKLYIDDPANLRLIPVNYLKSIYTYNIELSYSLNDKEYHLGKLTVMEYRISINGNPILSKAMITVSDLYSGIGLENAILYVNGMNVGTLGGAGKVFEVSLPSTPMPSMRTSIRHVDSLYPILLDMFNVNLTLAQKVANLVNYTMNYVWNNNVPPTRVYIGSNAYAIYDVYLPAFWGHVYITNIQMPNKDHFWDAKWYGSYLGYNRIVQVLSPYINTPYPAYPYKSKIVDATIPGVIDGGDAFLTALTTLNDPLYYIWRGLYYISQGRYDLALNDWNTVVSKWDGIGVKGGTGTSAYSTVRLAGAIILGSILAGLGYIDWSTVDNMVNVLLQLQWNGIGYYSPDGSSVYKIVRTDHSGGFIVSYGAFSPSSLGSSTGSDSGTGSSSPSGPIFVPFRPSLIENILDNAMGSPPEYSGPLPTNAETTLMSILALSQYAYWRMDVLPRDLIK